MVLESFKRIFHWLVGVIANVMKGPRRGCARANRVYFLFPHATRRHYLSPHHQGGLAISPLAAGCGLRFCRS
jgi:hypothetical protein